MKLSKEEVRNYKRKRKEEMNINMKEMKQKKAPKPFGMRLEEIPKPYLKEGKGLPMFLYHFGRIVIDNPIEGIFRKDSGVDEIENMKKKVNKHEYHTLNIQNEGEILNMGKTITMFFYLLPEPIFSRDDQLRLAKLLTQFETPKDLERTMNALCLAFNRIDSLKRKYILFSLNLYYSVSRFKTVHKMSIKNIGTCVAPGFFRSEGVSLEDVKEFTNKQISIISLLIALYPILASYYPEASDVLEPSVILQKSEVDHILKNPFAFDYGDYDFDGAKRFSEEYLSKFTLSPTLK